MSGFNFTFIGVNEFDAKKMPEGSAARYQARCLTRWLIKKGFGTLCLYGRNGDEGIFADSFLQATNETEGSVWNYSPWPDEQHLQDNNVDTGEWYIPEVCPKRVKMVYIANCHGFASESLRMCLQQVEGVVISPWRVNANSLCSMMSAMCNYDIGHFIIPAARSVANNEELVYFLQVLRRFAKPETTFTEYDLFQILSDPETRQ